MAAKAANRAKRQVLANMSHEPRTPLNGILGYAQILRRDPTLGERQVKGVTVIQQGGEHLLTLVNDILEFAKIEARELQLRPPPSNWATVRASWSKASALRPSRRA